MGVRQIFLRFSGCNLRCDYCDTDFSIKKEFRLENQPFSQKFVYLPNPVDISSLLRLVVDLKKKALANWLTLTGGEPLLQSDFLSSFLLEARKEGLKIFLETNATLPEEFLKVKKYLDFVSMDLKLPFLSRPKRALKKQFEFFRLASELKGEVKLVLVDFDHFAEKKGGSKAEDLIENFQKNIKKFSQVLPSHPLILQPATAFFSPDLSKMLEYQALALEIHPEVKLLPRLQVLYNLL